MARIDEWMDEWMDGNRIEGPFYLMRFSISKIETIRAENLKLKMSSGDLFCPSTPPHPSSYPFISM